MPLMRREYFLFRPAATVLLSALDEKIAQLKENPALATVPAIQNDRIISVKLCEVFASSMTGDTVEKFAQAFHPDCF